MKIIPDSSVPVQEWRWGSESANAIPILQNTPKPRLPREGGGPPNRPSRSSSIHISHPVHCSNTQTKDATHTWIPACAGMAVRGTNLPTSVPGTRKKYLTRSEITNQRPLQNHKLTYSQAFNLQESNFSISLNVLPSLSLHRFKPFSAPPQTTAAAKLGLVNS